MQPTGAMASQPVTWRALANNQAIAPRQKWQQEENRMAAHNEHHYIPKFLLEGWRCGEDEKLSHMRWIRGQMTELFFEADWGIRRIAKTREMLLIGDRPLTLFGPETKLDLIFLPLAPDVAFFISRSARMKQWVNSMRDSHLVRQKNKGTVEQASMYVWGNNFEHRRLLERRLHRTAAGRGIGIGPRPTL